MGSLASWFLLKTKYEQIAKEEIEFAVDRLEKKYGKEESSEEKEYKVVPGSDEKPSIKEYKSMLDSLGYLKEKKEKEEEEEEEVNTNMPDDIYVITPEEFSELEDYELETLTLYADGVLTDWYDEPIEDVDAYVGKESLTRFGEYEKDTVYVRNDATKCGYEIQRDLRKYSSVYPHIQED